MLHDNVVQLNQYFYWSLFTSSDIILTSYARMPKRGCAAWHKLRPGRSIGLPPRWPSDNPVDKQQRGSGWAGTTKLIVSRTAKYGPLRPSGRSTSCSLQVEMGRSFTPTWSERYERTHPSVWVLGLAHFYVRHEYWRTRFAIKVPGVRTVSGVRNVRVIFVLISSYEQKIYLNKFKIGTIFELEQILNWNKFRIWTNFEFEQISNLNKFQIGTHFKAKQFWNLNNFQNWTNLKIEQDFKIQTKS
jgi:hypothetical protein